MQDNYRKLVDRFGYGERVNADMDGYNLILLARIADNLDRLATIQEQAAETGTPIKKVAKTGGDGVQ